MSEKKKEQPVPKLHATGLGFAIHKRNEFFCRPHAGVTIEDVKNPQFWAHVAYNLRIGDRITAYAEDGTWYAELLVVASEQTLASVAVLNSIDLTVEAKQRQERLDELAKGYDVEWRGPAHKWCVINKVKNEMVDKGFTAKADAYSALSDHLRKFAA